MNAQDRLNRRLLIPVIAFGLSMLFLGMLAKDYIHSPNEASRLATVFALNEYGVWHIEKTPYNWTIDKIFYGGHFYSDKPPLFSLYLSFIYRTLKSVTAISFFRSEAIVYYGLVLFSSVLFSSLLIVLLAWSSCLRNGSLELQYCIIPLFAATATLQLPYSLVINNHLPAALLVTSIFMLLSRENKRRRLNTPARTSPGAYALDFVSGVLTGLLFAVDHLSGLVFCPLFVILKFILSPSEPMKKKFVFPSSFFFFLMGSLLPLVAHFSVNYSISGSLIPLSQQYEKYKYPGSYLDFETPAGKIAHDSLLSWLSYLFHLLLGKRGIFSYTPILGIALVILLTRLRKSRQLLKEPDFFLLIGIVSMVLLVSLISKNYGGSAYGVRWFLPFTPLLMLQFLYIDVSKLRTESPLKFIMLMILTLYSAGTAFIGAYEPWTQLHGNDFTLLNNIREMVQSMR